MTLQTLNKYNDDHELTHLDDAALEKVNGMLQNEFEATLVRAPGDRNDWALWLVQEVPE